MASFNKVILIGNLIRDPDVKQSRSGTSFCTITLAVNRTWYNKTDKKKEEETAFIDVGFFGRQAELVGEYLSKGSSLMVEGYLKLDQWEDKNSGEKKSKLKVQAQGPSSRSKPRTCSSWVESREDSEAGMVSDGNSTLRLAGMRFRTMRCRSESMDESSIVWTEEPY